jgi:hypothetical protein
VESEIVQGIFKRAGIGGYKHVLKQRHQVVVDLNCLCHIAIQKALKHFFHLPASQV